MSLLNSFLLFIVGMSLYKFDALLSQYTAIRAKYHTLAPGHQSALTFVFVIIVWLIIAKLMYG